jgi:hypothetical protein
MASDKSNREQFDRTANDFEQWLLRAEDLHTASDVLREKFAPLEFDVENDLAGAVRNLKYVGLIFPSAMLQGFAIEAFLKAYWLVQGNSLAKDGHYSIPSSTRDNHNLSAIADGFGFSLSTDEREVLSRLSLLVSSYGRYPITRRWEDNPLKPDKRGIPHHLSWSDGDHAVAVAIIEHLKIASKKA